MPAVVLPKIIENNDIFKKPDVTKNLFRGINSALSKINYFVFKVCNT